MLRKGLIWIRHQQDRDAQGFLIRVGIVLVASIIAGLLVDNLLPFNSWWNLLRSLILVPLSLSFFALCYAYSLRLHRFRLQNDDTWVPYRARYSPSWRRRIALIIAAVLFVFMYATGQGPVYTLMSSLFVSAAIALLAFIRPTKQEQQREELNIPDARDFQYQKKLRELEARRQAKLDAAEAKKKERLRKALGND